MCPWTADAPWATPSVAALPAVLCGAGAGHGLSCAPMTTDDRKSATMQTKHRGRVRCCEHSGNYDNNRSGNHSGNHGNNQNSNHSGNRACNRCDAPQGEIALLNGAEHVCGACIDLMGNLFAVAGRVALDLTPSIECGTGSGDGGFLRGMGDMSCNNAHGLAA